MSKETENLVWQSVVQRWERPGSQFYPKGLLQNEPNFNALQSYLRDASARGVQPSMENWQAIVEQATKDGRLQYDAPKPVEPPPFNPSDNLPHPGEPKLRKLLTLDDLNEMSAEQVRVFTQPAAFDTGLHQKFTDRATFIRQHRIRRAPKPETPVSALTPTTPKKPTRVYMLRPEEAKIVAEHNAYHQSCLDEANTIIRNHVGRNYGRTNGERMILTGVRDEAIRAGKSGKEVLEAVRTKWNSYGSNDSVH